MSEAMLPVDHDWPTAVVLLSVAEAASVGAKRCRLCGHTKPLTAFHRAKKALDGRQGFCKSCSTIAHAKWVQAHPERAAELRQQSRARHPEYDKNHYAEIRRRSPEYTVWKHMNGRCFNPNNPKFPAYGGRGIRVCDEWRGPGGFDRFIAYVGHRPSPRHSIDRFPNNDGNYEPGNVRWATPKEQAANTRRTMLITVDDTTKCASAWSIDIGGSAAVVGRRISRGASHLEAVTTPVRPRERLITVGTETLGAVAWSRRLGGEDSLVSRRIHDGWDEVDAASAPLGCKRRST